MGRSKVTALEQRRRDLVGENRTLIEKVQKESRGLSAAEKQDFDRRDAQIESLDDEIAKTKTAEADDRRHIESRLASLDSAVVTAETQTLTREQRMSDYLRARAPADPSSPLMRKTIAGSPTERATFSLVAPGTIDAIVRWRVSIDGQAYDLEDLPAWFTSDGLRVVQESDGFYMESERLEHLTSSMDVRNAAAELIPLLNGIGRLRRDLHRDVSLGTKVIEFADDGSKQHAFVFVPTVRGKSGVIGASEGEERRVRLALADPDVERALKLWGRAHDWTNLYKIFEIIEGRGDIPGSGWASANAITRFTRTANHQDAAGDDARHARNRAQPPPNPMSLAEADRLIGGILEKWLASLA